jgi:hypothetical protein
MGWRPGAPEQLALLLPRLEPDVLLISDNVLSHPVPSLWIASPSPGTYAPPGL